MLVALTVPRGGERRRTSSPLMAGAGAAAAEVGARGGRRRPLGRAGLERRRHGAGLGRARRSPAPAPARATALWVTGALGGARAALEAWRRGDAPDAEARRAFAHPVPADPCRAAGSRATARGAMIDLSDGLGADAAHLAAASGVAVALELDRVPVAGAGVEPRRAGSGVPPEQFAAESGEDYELLVALPPSASSRTTRSRSGAWPACRSPASARSARARACRRRSAGKPVALAGYDHFARGVVDAAPRRAAG